jgi:hypothetical protein
MTASGARTCGAWRNRATSLALVASFLLATHAWLPEAEMRATVQYLFVVTLGYGHLLGAVALPRAPVSRTAFASPHVLLAFFRTATALAGFAAYAWVIGVVPALVLPLLAVSAWHTVENDLAIGRAYAGGLRVGPLPRSRAHHVVSLGATGFVVVLGTWTESWRELAGSLGWNATGAGALVAGASGPGSAPLAGWLDLPDLFVLVTLHHLLSWLILLTDRVRALRGEGRGDEAASLSRRLVAVHLAPALACGLLLSIPAARVESIHLLVFGPAVYLYWSVLHVIQTSWRRGMEPRGCTPHVEATHLCP